MDVKSKILVQFAFILSSTVIFISSQNHGCPSLSFRTGVDIHCEHPITKESLDCQKMRMPVGTVAKFRCEEFFVTHDGETEGGKMICSNNGKWTPDLRFRSFACHMDCGKSYPDSAHTFWPWHVGIFARESRSTPGNFKFACGGTLINPFNADELLILTGAECIRNRNSDDLEIRLGLFSPDNINQKTGQTFSVRRIVTEDDGILALIQLSGVPILSKSVLPACLSTSLDFAKHQLQQESAFGQLVGFGDRNSNDALRNISAGVTPIGKCIDKRARIISKHSFCAGSDEGQNICNGDFGAGLLFPRFTANSERHFILGVLGEGLRKCKSHTWFIGVSDYADWIKQSALELHEDKQREHGDHVQAKPKRLPLQPIIQTLPPVIQKIASRPTPPAPKVQIPPSAIPKIQTPAPRFRIPVPKIKVPVQIEDELGNISEVSDFESLPIQVQDVIRGLIRSGNPQSTVVTVDHTEENSALSSTMKDYEIAAVVQHNLFRRRHGAPPVKLSPQLSQLAQAEAEQALATNHFKFGGFTNWYGISGKQMTFSRLIQDAVRDWYKTSTNYNWAHPRSNPFSQIVWRSTTSIGVGVAQRGKKQFAIVKYGRPHVNSSEREKSFSDNVLLPL